LILLILSIAIQDPLLDETLIDSLNKFAIPRFMKKQTEIYQMHPDHRKYFGPKRKFKTEQSEDQQILQSYRGKRADGVDTIHVAAIRVEFLEDTTSLTTGNGRFNLAGIGSICDTTYDTTMTGTDTLVDTTISRSLRYDPPHDLTYFNRLMEFLHNYYYKVSYGKLWIEWTVLPYVGDSGYSLPHEMKYYGDYENLVIGFFKLLRDAVEVADYDADFSNFDQIVVFHAGSGLQSDGKRDSPLIFKGHCAMSLVMLWDSGTSMIYPVKPWVWEVGLLWVPVTGTLGVLYHQGYLPITKSTLGSTNLIL